MLKSAKDGTVAAFCSNLTYFKPAKQAGLAAVSSFEMNGYHFTAAFEELGAEVHLFFFEPPAEIMRAIATKLRFFLFL